MVALARAGASTARIWVQQAHAPVSNPRFAFRFFHQQESRSHRSSLHTSAASWQQQQQQQGDGSGTDASDVGKRLEAGAALRPYRTVVPAADRLIVIGDVHGDVDAFRSCLRMADLVDDNDKWAGGETVVVQLGDIFDRGHTDLLVQEWVYRLAKEAERTNGAIYSIMGNHEMMNAMGDHSMATHKAFVPFNDLRPELDDLVGGDWSGLQGFPEWARCRVLAMRPGGPVARLMAAHAVSMKVGENLFVHAGLLPEHVRGPMAANKDSTGDEKTVADVEAVMEKVNAAARSWLLGEREIPEEMWAGDSPLWTRVYSDPESRDIDEAARLQLEEVLRLTGTKRMLVGHTPQRIGINSAADGQIWRCDTGMTAMMGGRPEVLEIKGDEITILTEYKSVPAHKRAASAPPAPAAGDDDELRRQ